MVLFVNLKCRAVDVDRCANVRVALSECRGESPDTGEEFNNWKRKRHSDRPDDREEKTKNLCIDISLGDDIFALRRQQWLVS